MSAHETAVDAIEAAIQNIATGQVKPDCTVAETLAIAYLSVFAITADEFKHYCERVRRISDFRSGVAA